MAALAGYKAKVGPSFKNAEEIVRVVYDFSLDGGATGALDIFTAEQDMIVTGFHLQVLTACTSGGSATLIVGVSGGDTDACLDATSGAVANLGANAVIGQEATVPFRLASGGKLIQTIGTAALTAGKIEYVFKIMKAS